jgi:FKBP-type peptidyl-prolyl cis-trans isomerase FkpA
MKIRRILYYALAISTALVLMSGCEEETSEEETAEQEQRFFNVYRIANYPDAELQASGLYYQEYTAGTGATPGPEDWVLVNHVAYLLPDDDVYDSYIENVARDNRFYDAAAMYGPYKMYNGTNVEGLKEGISMMREGGEATLMFTSDLGYGSANSGSVGAYRSLKYEIELLEVIGDMDNLDAYEQVKINTYLDTVAQYDTVYDAETEKVISYIVDVATDGPLVGLDSTISVAYKGYLLDGRVFDEKTAEDPFIFISTGVEWGARWDLVLPRLHEGEKVRMIFPYQLAYGEIGEYTSSQKVKIPPFETLIFDLEIISVEAELPVDPGGPE